ncbi:MAG: aminoglycoside phosphotransferase, partial [Cyanobacteria bacterium P01_H01_bin.15]
VTFDLASCRQILQGYLTAARDFLTPCDRKYLLDSVWLIAFELGLRFYSDFLAGNVYFRFDYPEHNLNRARVQFQLARSIDAQATAIQTAIEELT